MDAARAALGQDLFRDPRLSGDGTMACATCHDPEQGFTVAVPKAIGRGGKPLLRNAPSLWNAGWGKSYFWDGRAASLEEQAKGPLTAADEMAGRFEDMIARLGDDTAMARRFAEAFPATPAISEEAILGALAAYERTLVSPGTRFDAWVEGEDGALTDQEKRGFDLFVGRAGCAGCHGGWRFTDDGFHDIGLPGPDPGRGAVPGGVPGSPQFKTPSLRELERTAPYMHDGSLPTLRDVLNHYSGGLTVRPSLDSGIVRNLELDEAEKAALIAFLGTLSSP